MTERVLKGRGAIPGVVEGEAMVCPRCIQGWCGVDPKTGLIVESGHVHEGESFDGKILVMPSSKGSIGWSNHFHAAEFYGHKPLAFVLNKIDAKTGLTAVLIQIPTVCDFKDTDPCQEIADGDWLRVDGTRGEVTILKKA